MSLEKMPKHFSTIEIKYNFLGRGGGMLQTAPKYFSEHICPGIWNQPYPLLLCALETTLA